MNRAPSIKFFASEPPVTTDHCYVAISAPQTILLAGPMTREQAISHKDEVVARVREIDDRAIAMTPGIAIVERIPTTIHNESLWITKPPLGTFNSQFPELSLPSSSLPA